MVSKMGAWVPVFRMWNLAKRKWRHISHLLKKHFLFPTYFIYLCLALRFASQEAELQADILKDVYWRFPLALQNFAKFENHCQREKQRWTPSRVMRVLHTDDSVWLYAISFPRVCNIHTDCVGFHVAQSYNGGQCEGLEEWERVTDSHVFSFYKANNRNGESPNKNQRRW